MRLTQSSHRIQIGEYVILPHTTYLQLRHDMLMGRGRLRRFSVVEGTTFHEVVQALAENPHLKFHYKGMTDADVFENISDGASLPYEGKLYPATYTFVSGADASVILRKAYAAFHAAYAKTSTCPKDLPYHGLDARLIVASLIEKESSYPEEFKRIAGVIVNRLNKGMRLQIDAALLYLPQEKRRTNVVDRSVKSRYNVYRHHGLPPTAIAIPSRLAMLAACHPAKTNELYYVANGLGHHTFTTNFKDHLRAKRKLKAKLKQQPS